jgi:hypothetical protein
MPKLSTYPSNIQGCLAAGLMRKSVARDLLLKCFVAKVEEIGAPDRSSIDPLVYKFGPPSQLRHNVTARQYGESPVPTILIPTDGDEIDKLL